MTDPIRIRETAEQLRALRLKAGLTQAALARRLKVRQHYISRIESGRANLSIRTLEKVARALGKSVRVGFVDSGEILRDRRGGVLNFGGWETEEAKLRRMRDWTPDEIFDWQEEANRFMRDAKAL